MPERRDLVCNLLPVALVHVVAFTCDTMARHQLVFSLVLTVCAAAANDGPIAETDGPVASRRRTGPRHSIATVPGFCGPTPESSDCWIGVKSPMSKPRPCMAGQRGPSG